MPRRTTRRQFLKTATAAAALSAVPSCAPAPPRRDLPNLLFVLSDSHRAAATGCYGHELVRTPNFDAVAASGLRLDTCVSNTPVCRPYRASLMTGCYSHRTGMLTNTSKRNFGVKGKSQWFPQGLPLLGKTFEDAGYRCGYIGKWHLGVGSRDPGPLRFGFNDYWAVGVDDVHDYYRWRYATGEDDFVEGKSFRPMMETDLAVDCLREFAGSGSPWFLLLSWGPPHDPYKAPRKYQNYAGAPLPPNVPDGDLREKMVRALPHYYGLVEAIDHEFGRLLAELDALGVADDTIVVYTSDHGSMMGSHAHVGKEVPYTYSTTVPLVARWPGTIPAGATLGMPFGTPDIFPTLSGLVGLPPPGASDGVDFSATWRGEADAPWQDHAYLVSHLSRFVPWPGWRGVRTERHLYARKQDAPWLLFDLVDDPYELRNLVDEEPELRNELDARTSELMERLGDTWAT